MSTSYQHFLHTKRLVAPASGITVDAGTLHPLLFPFQRAIVTWALARGRAAIFADTGTGKTAMQLVWAQQISAQTGLPVLILAPLAVSQQTVREGSKFGVPVTLCRTQEDARPGVNITNYEMLTHFTAGEFGGLVLDESSILKSFSGVMRRDITEFGRAIPYRLACTATPAPNDLLELSNHAEFLNVMSSKEIIAIFFTQDGNTTHAWRLKGHAREAFWHWLASWSVALRRPSDLGFSDDGYVLPALQTHEIVVSAPPPTVTLFPVEAITLQERQQARRESTDARVATTAALVNASDAPWVVWCDLNAESQALTKTIAGAVEVTGSDSPEHKERVLLDFVDGTIRVLVTKPSIAGFGMNWQHCAHMAFVGLSDSWEQLYQATRRCWRFGQQQEVHRYLISAETEGAVKKNIDRKETQAEQMMGELVQHMAGLSLTPQARDETTYEEHEAHGRDWSLLLGDSVQLLDSIESESVGLTVFSPPFPGMYAYTNSVHDMGNTRDMAQMLDQFRYLVGREKLWRVLMPGRMCCIHLTQSPAFKGADGYIGLKDFRGDVIRLMSDEGWIYYGEVTIDKDPQVKAQRTKERGLMFKTLATDSSLMRMAMADYLVYFMKPGQNPQPIRAGMSGRRNRHYANADGWITNEEWIEWAHPIWYGIRESNVLNVRTARESDDERHLCPLQLDVIERAVKLWSAPGDLVLDPFAGVGSTGSEALRLRRRFTGVELKRSYFETACRNLRQAEATASAATLWAQVDDAAEAEASAVGAT